MWPFPDIMAYGPRGAFIPHEDRPGIANRNFPKQTRHLHQDNAYQFRQRKFVFIRKWYIASNDSSPYKSAYQEQDLYADYDPMVGIKIAAVLSFFLLMMAIHLFIRSRRKKRERLRQKRLLELAQQTQPNLFSDDVEKALPRIEVDVFDATAQWVKALDSDEDNGHQKQYLDVVESKGSRLTPKSSLKKKNYSSSTPSRSHSTKSLPDEQKRVHFDLSSKRGKRWSSFSGMHGKRRHHVGTRKTRSMYVRHSYSQYEMLQRCRKMTEHDCDEVNANKTNMIMDTKHSGSVGGYEQLYSEDNRPR